jgi:hypothetical protein
MDNKLLSTTCGREVFIVRFEAELTFIGLMLGTLERASAFRRKRRERIAERMLPPGKPLAFVDPGGDALPKWTCVVELESRQDVHHDDPDYNSRLYMMFYADDLTISLTDLIATNLEQVEWENTAEDYDITYF